MKKNVLFLGCLLFVVLTGFLSCSKDDEGEFLVSGTNIVGVWFEQKTKTGGSSTILDIGSNGMFTLLRSGYLNIDGYIEVSKSSKSHNEGPFLINPDGTFDGTYGGDKAQYKIILSRHTLNLVVTTEENGKKNTFRIHDFVKAKGIKWVE